MIGNNCVSLKKKRKQQFWKNNEKASNSSKKTGEKKKKPPPYARNILMRGLMEKKMASMAVNKTNSKFGDTPIDDKLFSSPQTKIKRSL